MNSIRRPSRDQAIVYLDQLRATYPSQNMTKAEVFAAIESWVDVLCGYPINAIEKAFRDFRTGKVDRGASQRFMPHAAEFGAYLRNYPSWRLEPPKHLDAAQISQDAIAEQRKQIEVQNG